MAKDCLAGFAKQTAVAVKEAAGKTLGDAKRPPKAKTMWPLAMPRTSLVA